jgi:phosphopantothenoylcysteine decarboxylase/phosphopantothenate--cysteine ligase
MLIAVGVTGGIGAYKAVEVVRGLQKRGHDVVAIMTATATRFVGPVTFEAITRRRVITDQFEPGANADIEHIAIASSIDLLLIVPATANVIAKMAHGIADDFLTTLYTATRAPVLVAPAMNTQMFSHDAVVHNLDLLAARGVRFVEPGEGYLACGWIGKGRLAEPDAIVKAAEDVLAPDSPLRGLRVLITAGPTFEDVDPVRYLGNRSSGRMGFALAAEATRRGARVTLVAGPTSIEPPASAQTIRVRGALEMHRAVIERVEQADVVIMAAAVADYTPERRADQKLQKHGETLTLTLKKTPDILAELGARRLVAGHGPLLVGFAAETESLLTRAAEKLAAKHVDIVVANDVSAAGAGFDSDTNAVTILSAAGQEAIPLQSKDKVAAEILLRVERLIAASHRAGALS